LLYFAIICCDNFYTTPIDTLIGMYGGLFQNT